MPPEPTGVGWLPTKMIVLVGHDNEQRVVLGDPVRREPREELSERVVIRLELVDVFLLARAECMSRGGNARDGIDRQRVPIVRVGNVEIDDWNALLEHRRRVTERLRRRGVEDVGIPVARRRQR